MPHEISLTDAQKATIIQQEDQAQKDTRLVRWLTELLQQKQSNIAEKNKQRTSLDQEISQLEADLAEIKSHIEQVIALNKTSYKKIIEGVIAELGVPPNTKLQLLFDAGVPKINLLDTPKL